MKAFKGFPYNMHNSVIGLVTYNRYKIFGRSECILVTSERVRSLNGFSCCIFLQRNLSSSGFPCVSIGGECQLHEGDCVLISTDGTLTVLWDSESGSNSLLLTEACNCHCIMCPQPPKPQNKELYEVAEKIVRLIKPDKKQPICITGGEPTLFRKEFISLLLLLKQLHGTNPFFLLTNGRTFSDEVLVRDFVSAQPTDLTVCVSLHADVDEIHDSITKVKGSFYQTVAGLHNLARYRQKVEIRIVVSMFNYRRLESIANYIYRNFPFIHHCAFMGLEITGDAEQNKSDIWVDPYEYKDELSKAVRLLSRADLSVSIYNIPMCILNRDCWSFARQSISDWKCSYLSECDDCDMRRYCSGVFSTSGENMSTYIKSIINYE